MKDRFFWYVDSVRPKNGHQSNHVATVAIIRREMDGGRPYYHVGVAAKHQRDGLPFIKKEGRNIAVTRALGSIPAFSIPEVLEQVFARLCRDIRDSRVLLSIDSGKLLNRIEFVLRKFGG